MAVELAIEKLKTSNQGLQIIQKNVHDQLSEIAIEPKLEGLTIDLENLFESYLDTWVKSNLEIISLLEKGN